ncbi:hypothetical protein EC973_007805 [Apophysomyces ossiformis]|uniref:Uncharacterized protein n=1 Tax=Apophysomyces ossiformis TaxID=679940 RepID=A0A8H7BPF3_9FUNG|nr:hypothetical protein EC973_007805 [Apophysomyces ossiformis]
MVCDDVTELKKLYEANKVLKDSVIIMRLTMYGTLDAYYTNEDMTIEPASVGSPIMRFTHPEDVVHLCSASAHPKNLGVHLTFKSWQGQAV